MKGCIEPVSIAIIVGCMLGGGYFMYKSKTVDHPLEQVIESVLEKQGIDIDFSEHKKKED